MFDEICVIFANFSRQIFTVSEILEPSVHSSQQISGICFVVFLLLFLRYFLRVKIFRKKWPSTRLMFIKHRKQEEKFVLSFRSRSVSGYVSKNVCPNDR